ncbi:MAG: FkbM family methyltransferase [Bacteroidota bacterium]
MTAFTAELVKSIITNSNNKYETHQDGWFVSHNYFIREKQAAGNFWDKQIQKRTSKYYTSKNSVENTLYGLFRQATDIAAYEYLYNVLGDDYSKKRLIEVVTFRIMGPKYFRLSLENEAYNNFHVELNALQDKNQTLEVKYNNWKLYLYEFVFYNKPVKCYFTTMGIVTIFKVEQYAYKPQSIAVEDNDVVIDGGACWGDTALYFANKAENTKVFAFEFVPSNIELFNKNIALNQNTNIELVNLALSGESGKSYNIIDNGASSYFTEEKTDNSITISTTSIDDFVDTHKVTKLDFIKLDIEGAELDTLKGAINSIKKFRPKLAVAVYHNPVDFYEIPEFIIKLNLGYELYLDHFTPNNTETILFAKVKDAK